MSKNNKSIELSVVVPMHNEAAAMDSFFNRFELLFAQLKMSYEIVCVNDGSTDDTLEALIAHQKKNPNIKVINLSRNFGKEVAMTAALDYCSGQVVVPIDADLQDPPELIPEMLEKWREGYDVVFATRKERHGETFIKRFTSRMFYKVLDYISETKMPRDTGDFRLMDRCVVDALKKLPERTRYMKGLFAWVGFKQTAIFYDRDPRLEGETSWNYIGLWRLAVEGITSFSTVPLKMWSYVGSFLSVVALLYALFLIIRVMFFGIDLPGYASMMVVILFLGGIQLITLGIIGEYMSRIFTEVKARPLYLVRETWGFEEEKPDDKE